MNLVVTKKIYGIYRVYGKETCSEKTQLTMTENTTKKLARASRMINFSPMAIY